MTRRGRKKPQRRRKRRRRSAKPKPLDVARPSNGKWLVLWGQLDQWYSTGERIVDVNVAGRETPGLCCLCDLNGLRSEAKWLYCLPDPEYPASTRTELPVCNDHKKRFAREAGVALRLDNRWYDDKPWVVDEQLDSIRDAQDPTWRERLGAGRPGPHNEKLWGEPEEPSPGHMAERLANRERRKTGYSWDDTH